MPSPFKMSDLSHQMSQQNLINNHSLASLANTCGQATFNMGSNPFKRSAGKAKPRGNQGSQSNLKQRKTLSKDIKRNKLIVLNDDTSLRQMNPCEVSFSNQKEDLKQSKSVVRN